MGRPKKIIEFIRELTTKEGDVFARVCPSCKRDVIHINRYGCILSHRQNRNCYECANELKPQPPQKIIEERRKKQSDTMKKLCQSVPRWNKGLTKENSGILKNMGENHKGFKHDLSTKKIISQTSKQRWDTGFYDFLFTRSPVFVAYRNKVQKLTDRIKHLIPNYDRSKQGRCGVKGAYQVDHIVTVKYGFLNNIPPEKISELSNLRFITWEENLARKRKNYDEKNII